MHEFREQSEHKQFGTTLYCGEAQIMQKRIDFQAFIKREKELLEEVRQVPRADRETHHFHLPDILPYLSLPQGHNSCRSHQKYLKSPL